MGTFALTYNIWLDNKRLKGITKVELFTSVENLSNTATITLPEYINNVPYEIDKKIKRGMKVRIDIGYDNFNRTEFRGYVRSVSVNNPVVIECEDEMYLFRKAVKSEVFINKTVTQILQSVCTQIGYSLVSKVSDLKYDKFVIQQATGYEVLTKIKEQFALSLTIYEEKLYANLRYTERFGEETIKFDQNVKSSNLKYVSAEDVKVLVEVKGVGADNKATKTITAGTKGGEVVRLSPKLNITNETVLEQIAKQELSRLSYTGFRGDVTLFGQPFISAGFTARVLDPDYRNRDGVYFVIGTVVRFSKAGFERQVTLGQRLS